LGPLRIRMVTPRSASPMAGRSDPGYASSVRC
jgi:hypothetical protein